MIRFHDLIYDAVAVRLPHTVAVQQRIDAAVTQGLSEGLDEHAIEDRAVAMLADDADAVAVAEQRGAMATFVEGALALGATYDAATDIWNPPADMTFEEMFAAIIALLRAKFEAPDTE